MRRYIYQYAQWGTFYFIEQGRDRPRYDSPEQLGRYIDMDRLSFRASI